MNALERVRAAITAYAGQAELRVFAEHMPTVAAAAEVVGVEPAQIAKSILLFAGGRPVLVVAAGDRWVDRQKVKALMGGMKVKLASAGEVLAVTGFVAGGVAPVGLLSEVTVFLDETLRRFDQVWAGGGIPEALLRLQVESLPELTGGRFVDVVREPV